MDIWQAIVLGLTQGLTEFLPVSSSGHLVFLQRIFGVEEGGLFFNIILHLGTRGVLERYFGAVQKTFFHARLSYRRVGSGGNFGTVA